MRRVSLVLASTLAVVVPLLGLGAADARPAKPRAELVSKNVTGSLSAGKVVVSATVKNKGNRKAKKSQTTFLLSKDGTVSADDKVLGTLATKKVKSKKTKKVSGTFAVPASAAAGSYRVIACADSAAKVKERKEGNNCKASKGAVTVAAPKQVTISWAVGPVPGVSGSVAATATNGTCTASDPLTGAGSCTVTAGVGSVTLTATPLALPVFQGWTGTGCVSSTNPLVLTSPATNVACTANFSVI
jgi:hypothetical protein